MLVLCQHRWLPGDPDQVSRLVGAAVGELATLGSPPNTPGLVLLPHAPAVDHHPALESVARASLAGAALRHETYLAASAITRSDSGNDSRTVGWLIAPDGTVLLETSKITPDLIEGFTDSSSALGRPHPFPVAKLPFAQVGMLVGEDILVAQHARALAFNGAELILNPSLERSDGLVDMRIRSRFGRATENACYVATASVSSIMRNGVEVTLPVSTGLYTPRMANLHPHGNETFVLPDVDMEALRRARATPQGSFPAILRADVYGRGYRRRAAETGARPSTRAQWHEHARHLLALEAAAIGPSRQDYELQYDVLVMQTVPRLIPLACPTAHEIITRNLEESLALAATRANIPSMRLVVFPEFWLTGPGGIGGIQRTVQDLELMAITYPGPVFDAVSEFAQHHRVFVAFQNFEVHPSLPGRVFNSAFLIDDSGNLVHTYRKIQCADVWGFLPDTTPGSILDEYLQTFGPDSLFPVADTPIGRLANMICFDNMHPEIAHGLRAAGAEVILHSSSEPHGAGGRMAWDNCRHLRAFENCAYVISAIDGGEYKSPDSEHMTYFRRGHARIINHDGTLQGSADGPGPVTLRGHVDLAALRRARANPLRNLALWNDACVYAANYAPDNGFPSNLWADKPYDNPYLGARQLRAVIDRYMEAGIYVPPASDLGADRYRTSDQV